MARRNTRKTIEDLLSPYSAELQSAFISAIQDIKDGAELASIVRALERMDIDAAIRALGIDASAFAQLSIGQTSAYNAAGTMAAATIPRIPDPMGGASFIVRFNPGAPETVLRIAQQSGDAIVEIVQDQLTMARNHITEGLRAGQGPRAIALDLVGRIDPRTRQRTGGAIGLTDVQASYVRNARDQLAGADLRGFLSRKLRDKRYDKMILRSITDKKPLPKATIDRIAKAYEASLLRARGETIGRTEALSSLHMGQDEAFRQAVREGKLQPYMVRRVWRTASDSRVRDSHGSMQGQSVGLDEPFVTGNGVRLMYPGDPSGPASEIINCRCHVNTRIDFLSNIGRR